MNYEKDCLEIVKSGLSEAMVALLGSDIDILPKILMNNNNNF